MKKSICIMFLGLFLISCSEFYDVEKIQKKYPTYEIYRINNKNGYIAIKGDDIIYFKFFMDDMNEHKCRRIKGFIDTK